MASRCAPPQVLSPKRSNGRYKFGTSAKGQTTAEKHMEFKLLGTVRLRTSHSIDSVEDRSETSCHTVRYASVKQTCAALSPFLTCSADISWRGHKRKVRLWESGPVKILHSAVNAGMC